MVQTCLKAIQTAQQESLQRVGAIEILPSPRAPVAKGGNTLMTGAVITFHFS